MFLNCSVNSLSSHLSVFHWQFPFYWWEKRYRCMYFSGAYRWYFVRWIFWETFFPVLYVGYPFFIVYFHLFIHSAKQVTWIIKPRQYKWLNSSRVDVQNDQTKCFHRIIMAAIFFVVVIYKLASRCKCLNLRGDSVK